MSDHGFSKACPSGNHMIGERFEAGVINLGDYVDECANCGDRLKEGEGDEFNDLLFCDQACISEWWHVTAERWGEDR